MTSTGEALILALNARGVEVVFGIPGVHTVELYRGLSASPIRHVTPRHEQGAGFMADGYARVSGKPGVAFVITGPGVTNILTPMAQARADSVPLLVVSGVNETSSLGLGMGHLHELPDQHALVSQVALVSQHVARPDQLGPAVSEAFRPFTLGRPGPTHIQIPLDVAPQPCARPALDSAPRPAPPKMSPIYDIGARLAAATRPVILAGGGARGADAEIRALAERLDAPVIQTVNARGMMFGHALSVPASPSLTAIHALIESADAVIALGTELGPTDYDMYATGRMPAMAGLIRVDLCADQAARFPADITLQADTREAVQALLTVLPTEAKAADGQECAAQARQAAWEEIGPAYRAQVKILEALREAVPQSIMVGDSTQPIYAGNLYYEHDRPGGWFNAATGYGALGYGIPAAIGAAIAEPKARVIGLIGDGGAQFSLPEIMVAVEENLPITFVIWNNHGYREIANAMQDAGVTAVGCDPAPPDFHATAQSLGLPFAQVSARPDAVAQAMAQATQEHGPVMIEISEPKHNGR